MEQHKSVAPYTEGMTINYSLIERLLKASAEQTERVELLYQGKNEDRIMADAAIEENSVEENSVENRDGYREIRIACFKPGQDAGMDCIADVFVGLCDTGEVRVLLSLEGDGDAHQLAVYPERKRKDAVEDWS